MRMSYKKGKSAKSGKMPTTTREKALAAKYGNKKVITRGDIITAAKEKSGKRTMAMGGGMMRRTFSKGGGSDASKFHTKKDGTKARKGLYYYMNRAKKRGTSRPGKGTVTDKALKRSAKTAKKA